MDPEVKYVLDRLSASGLNLEIISENQGAVRGTNGVNYEAASHIPNGKIRSV